MRSITEEQVEEVSSYLLERESELHLLALRNASITSVSTARTADRLEGRISEHQNLMCKWFAVVTPPAGVEQPLWKSILLVIRSVFYVPTETRRPDNRLSPRTNKRSGLRIAESASTAGSNPSKN